MTHGKIPTVALGPQKTFHREQQEQTQYWGLTMSQAPCLDLYNRTSF